LTTYVVVIVVSLDVRNKGPCNSLIMSYYGDQNPNILLMKEKAVELRQLETSISSSLKELSFLFNNDPVPEIMTYYEYSQKLAERQLISAECPPYTPLVFKRNESPGLRRETYERERIANHLERRDTEVLARQIRTVHMVLEKNQYVKIEDLYLLPPKGYIAEDGTYKMGAMRKFARFLKKVLENTEYMTTLLNYPDLIDKFVDWKVFRNTGGATLLNVKRGIIRSEDFPQKGDMLTLHDKKTGQIYVFQTYDDHRSIFLLYLQMYSMYTLDSKAEVLEPSYNPPFDYNLLFRVLFQLPNNTDANLMLS